MIPDILQATLWSVGVNKLDLKRDRDYIVHQILAYGTWSDIKWLFSTYRKSEIVESFVKHPAKNYLPASYHFVKDILLGLSSQSLDEKKYDTFVPRFTR